MNANIFLHNIGKPSIGMLQHAYTIDIAASGVEVSIFLDSLQDIVAFRDELSKQLARYEPSAAPTAKAS